MQLKGRLYLIAGKVPVCNTVADIGTDHAYIPVYLVAKDMCEKVIASDVGIGPVRAAEKNIRAYNLEDFIETRLGDGLDTIEAGECDTIIIAGMGGILITEILERGFEKAKIAPVLILQPMNAHEVLRQWLYEKGFEIYDEELASEGEKLYTVICAKWTGNTRQLEDVYYHIGEKLFEKKDELLPKLIEKKLKQADKVLNGLKKTAEDNSEVENKYRELRKRLVELSKQVRR